ncbi:methyltransferase domain-containing protein [Actinotalea ferrariae]|nr:methyltransferase domain-containing protein [Actinotalea ferrariae]
MDGGDDDAWSAVAGEWADRWGAFADPVRAVLLDATRTGPGTRLLDVGCGSGELLALALARGASASGADPAPGMVHLARTRAHEADVRVAEAAALPWPDASADVTTAVNALELTGDPAGVLPELVRVTAPGGLVAVANWAEAARNDLDAVEAAVARALDDEPGPDGELRLPGGLERLLAAAGLTVEASGLVEAPWDASDDDALVRGVLLGEDDATQAELAPTVVGAAAGFRTAGGGYRLRNAFRYAVARTPG